MMTTSKNNIVNSNIGQKKIAAAGNDNKGKLNGEKEKKVKLHTIGISPDTAQQMMTSMEYLTAKTSVQESRSMRRGI